MTLLSRLLLLCLTFSAFIGGAASAAEVIEPNAYVQYPNGHWADAKAPWRMGGFSETTNPPAKREAACEQALSSLARAVAEEEKSGLAQVTQKTDCVCRTVAPANTKWYCQAYYQKTNTGKKAPTAQSR